MPPLCHQIINGNEKKAPIIYSRQNIYPSDSLPSQIPAPAILSCLFDTDIPKSNVAILPSWTLLWWWDGCLPFISHFSPLTGVMAGVWLLRFLLQTEKRTVHILPVLSAEQTPAEFICVLKAPTDGCITLCNTCWYGHSFISYSNRPLLVFLLPDSKPSWDAPSHSCEFLDHFLSNDDGSSSQLDQTSCCCSNYYPV